MRSKKVDRRTFLASVAAAAALPGISLGGPRRRLAGAGLHHAVLDVTDPERSLAFYQGLLGLPVQAREGRTTVLRVGDGPKHIVLRPVSPGSAPRISRIGIAVEDFEIAGAIDELSGHGVRHAGEGAPADPAMRSWTELRGAERTRELLLGDPHGIVLHLVDPSHCGGGGPSGSSCGPVEEPDTPGLIAVRDFNHFTNNVADPERANTFYGDVFGARPQVYQAAAAALDIDGGGPQFLMFTGGSARAGSPGVINHLCFSMEGFDTEAILATLANYGIRPRAEGEANTTPLISYVSMRMPNRGGAPGGTPELYFTDPDGLRMQLQDASYCGGGGVLGNIC